MRIFISYRSNDLKQTVQLKKEIEKRIRADLLMLDVNSENEKWFQEVKNKIDQCDMVLFVLGETSHESKNVDKELQYALKRKKRILLYRLNPDQDDIVNAPLFYRDNYTNTDKPLFKEVTLDDVEKVLQHGYSFDVWDTLNDTLPPKREEERIEQYKAYLATSEDVLHRRQNTSNFYTTINTSMLTIVTTVAGVLQGIPALENVLTVIALIFLPVCVVGILLNINWMSLLESYGRLNSAKLRVISEMEKNLPAKLYDTEWKVMSERLCGKEYVSFTAIEKRLPMVFIGLYGVLGVISAVLLVYSLAA